jgi:hypothetical protein
MADTDRQAIRSNTATGADIRRVEGRTVSAPRPLSSLEVAQIGGHHGRPAGRVSHRYVVHAFRIMLRTVMIVSARSKNASMTVSLRS